MSQQSLFMSHNECRLGTFITATSIQYSVGDFPSMGTLLLQSESDTDTVDFYNHILSLVPSGHRQCTYASQLLSCMITCLLLWCLMYLLKQTFFCFQCAPTPPSKLNQAIIKLYPHAGCN